MKIIVCGGRDFEDLTLLTTALGRFYRRFGVSLLVHGDAQGADRMAGAWASERGVPVKTYPVTQADWKQHGHAAGPRRNQIMLDETKPDCVLAFPGGPGTGDMIRRAQKAGVKVYLIGNHRE